MRGQRIIAAVLTAWLILIMLFPAPAYAKVPYQTWFLDHETNRVIRIQPLYVPGPVISGSSLDMPLSDPRDLYIAANDHVFVADTGNNRIVELDREGNFLQTVGDMEGEGALNGPEGVFVSEAGLIYVADTGNRRIAIYDTDGAFREAFYKPETHLIPEGYFFVPKKIAADRRGVMYIVVKDSYQGLMRLDKSGVFTGFFGSNKTQIDLLTRLKRLVLNKQQLQKEIAKRPGSIENVALDKRGFLITTSSGLYEGQIKKLNAGGMDAFLNKPFKEYKLVDTAIDAGGFLYGLNMELGEISIYDPFGNVLAYFGGVDKAAQQAGIFNYPTSVAINSQKEIWVADSSLNLLQVFTRTEFGASFLTAVELYTDGSYEESIPYWDAVMEQNGMMNLPYKGLGEIALTEKRYEAALQHFEDAYDAEGYSEAYWNIRYAWIQAHLPVWLLGLVTGAILIRWLVIRSKPVMAARSWHPYIVRIGMEARDALYAMFHPYEGFYRLKERKITIGILLGIAAAAIAIRLLSIYGMGFIFHPYDLGKVNLAMELAVLLVPWATWIVANYLVSTIKGGEGRFREVLQASMYAMVPYIVLMLPVIAISNLVVLEERVIVDATMSIVWIWISVQFFVMTQVIHNFDFMETLKNIAITIFTICVIWIFLVIMSGLTYNLFDFLKQIFREVAIYV